MSIQEIGITIDLSRGEYSNTVYKNGNLQLVELGVDGDGKNIYVNNGYWESEPILIQDKIKSFKNVVKTLKSTGGATYKIYTKTSDDGFTWGSYILINSDNTVSNPPAKYAMLKIEIFPEKIDSNFFIDNFNSNKYSNDFVNQTAGVLELKKDYTIKMDDITSSSGFAEGFLYSKTIPKSKLKKVDIIKLM